MTASAAERAGMRLAQLADAAAAFATRRITHYIRGRPLRLP
jgi:hypothetical protein